MGTIPEGTSRHISLGHKGGLWSVLGPDPIMVLNARFSLGAVTVGIAITCLSFFLRVTPSVMFAARKLYLRSVPTTCGAVPSTGQALLSDLSDHTIIFVT
jgi:hypothetical protein